MATIKITGVDESTAQFVASRARSLHFKGQAEYLRNLVREDMARAATERRSQLAGILEPLHAHAEEHGYTEEFLAEVFERARAEVAAIKKISGASSEQ
jgi:chorismate mutase